MIEEIKKVKKKQLDKEDQYKPKQKGLTRTNLKKHNGNYFASNI